MSPALSAFTWNGKRRKAAYLLADGYSSKEAASAVGVDERSVRRWKADMEFSAEVDRLTMETDIATRAERLRIAKRAVRQHILDENIILTKEDILAWLKFAQSETDGANANVHHEIEVEGEDVLRKLLPELSSGGEAAPAEQPDNA